MPSRPITYVIGYTFNAEDEVQALKKLRHRCDQDLSGAIERIAKGTQSPLDPSVSAQTCGKGRYFRAQFTPQSDGDAACVASYRNDATYVSPLRELVVYAVHANNCPPDSVLNAFIAQRIDFDP